MEKEVTCCILKPDCLENGWLELAIDKINQTGLFIAMSKVIILTTDQVFEFWGKDEAWYLQKGMQRMKDNDLFVEDRTTRDDAIAFGKGIINQLATYLTRGPVMVMAVVGPVAVQKIIEITGPTEPISAPPGTIRSWSTDSYEQANRANRALENVIHRSGSQSEAASEIAFFFTEEEIRSFIK
jgi:nucleoside-diphosphate kinase